MKKKSMLLLLIVAVLLVALPVVTLGQDKPTREEWLYQMGLIERQAAASSFSQQEDYAFLGRTIAITRAEYEKILARYQLSQIPNAEERVRESMLRREALYHIALQAGFQATEEEIQAFIDEQIEVFTQEVEDNDEFNIMMDAAGLTAEEYFQGQYELYDKLLTSTAHLSDLRDRTYGSGPEPEYWDEMIDKMVQDYIAADEVQDLR